jgi:hypothetical protein
MIEAYIGILKGTENVTLEDIDVITSLLIIVYIGIHEET